MILTLKIIGVAALITAVQQGFLYMFGSTAGYIFMLILVVALLFGHWEAGQ